MALVDYSDSESEAQGLASDHDQQGKRKRKAEHVEDEAVIPIKPKPPPPLPTSFHSLYATNVRTSTSDDPTLHAGRTRQVRHVVGNWPTHIYLEWYPSQSELAILDNIIKKSGPISGTARDSSENQVHSFLRSDLGAQQPLHISLSAPLVLQTTEKDQFEDNIAKKLGDSHIKHFAVEATKLEWVANHDKTRSFLVLKLSKPEKDQLNRLLSVCNVAAQRFGLPQLYQDETDTLVARLPPERKGTRGTSDMSDAFHISIAWTLEEPGDHARRSLAEMADDQLRGLKVSFSLLKLKIGSSVLDLPLE